MSARNSGCEQCKKCSCLGHYSCYSSLAHGCTLAFRDGVCTADMIWLLISLSLILGSPHPHTHSLTNLSTPLQEALCDWRTLGWMWSMNWGRRLTWAWTLSNVVFDYTSELYYCHDHESIGAAHQAILSSISFLYYCLFLEFYTSVKSRRNGILANSKWWLLCCST